MKRLFLGVPLSESVQGKISPVLEKLAATHANLKLVAVKNLHFTIKFMGSVEEENIFGIQEKIQKALSGIKKFTIALPGIGVFPHQDRINVVWVAASGHEFMDLMKTVHKALSSISPSAHEEAVPHATLARVKSGKNKEKLQQLLEKYKTADFGTMTIDKVILYESELTLAGPVYTVVREFRLG